MNRERAKNLISSSGLCKCAHTDTGGGDGDRETEEGRKTDIETERENFKRVGFILAHSSRTQYIIA